MNDATVDGSETGSSFEQALHLLTHYLRLHDTMFWEKKPNATRPGLPPIHAVRGIHVCLCEEQAEDLQLHTRGPPDGWAPHHHDEPAPRRWDKPNRRDCAGRAAQETADTKVIGNVWRYRQQSAGLPRAPSGPTRRTGPRPLVKVGATRATWCSTRSAAAARQPKQQRRLAASSSGWR